MKNLNFIKEGFFRISKPPSELAVCVLTILMYIILLIGNY